MHNTLTLPHLGPTGWLEIVIGTGDVREAARPLESAGGWRCLVDGAADSGQNPAWGIEPGTALTQRLLQIPQMSGGHIRFVSFGLDGLPAARAVSAAPWDTGGIWLFSARTRDIDAYASRLLVAGMSSDRGVHEFDFEYLTVKECILTGRDGLQLSLLQQVNPPIEPPEPYAVMGHAFNAAIVCRDFDVSRRFFLDQLGFTPWLESSWTRDNPGLGLVAPREDFVSMESMDVSIVHPQGTNIGSVELLGYRGDLEIEDYSPTAHPPALGNLMLRFPVAQLGAWLEERARLGVTPLFESSGYELEPYGIVRSAVIESPDGVWLEFLELIDGSWL